jgi:Tfp pilus assembly protein PilV
MLIELAVAALVIGIGILALLGLAHVAERAAYDAEAETRATLFADEVFTTLRLYSDRYAQSTNQQGWIDFWVGVADGQALLLAAEWLSLWENSDDPIHPRTIVGDSQEHTAYWIPIADDEESASMPDYALRYRLTIARPEETSSAATSLTTPPLPAMLLATLHVWYGASKVAAEPYTFFTAFSNSGSLP